MFILRFYFRRLRKVFPWLTVQSLCIMLVLGIPTVYYYCIILGGMRPTWLPHRHRNSYGFIFFGWILCEGTRKLPFRYVGERRVYTHANRCTYILEIHDCFELQSNIFLSQKIRDQISLQFVTNNAYSELVLSNKLLDKKTLRGESFI